MSLKFGTSGLRGLADALLDGASARYAYAFGRHLVRSGALGEGGIVYVGRDLRESSPAIAADCWRGLHAAGLVPVDCDAVPTPALAFCAMAAGAAALMVTGSHIPADRNGLKFYRPDGEIGKDDEAAIAAIASDAGTRWDGPFPEGVEDRHEASRAAYVERYAGFMAPDALDGMRIGLYEHSSVARDILAEIVAGFGATIVPLGRSDSFVAVDTEAVPAETLARFAAWTAEHRLDAVLSTDGDGDRPLVADETGAQIRGDALGLIGAKHLRANRIVTPVTSSSGIEAHGIPVARTRVGSPYVLAAMAEAAGATGTGDVIIGFEANGGLMTGTPVTAGSTTLGALPTRDAVLPMLCILARAAAEKRPLSALVEALGLPVSLSGRIEDFAQERSAALVDWLTASGDHPARFADGLGAVARVAATDGIQIFFDDDAMLHVRPSGNAPEMRCYAEAGNAGRAGRLLEEGLARIDAFTAR